MRLSGLLLTLFRFLIPPALIFTTYLYLYPAAQGCAFPDAKPAEAACVVPGQQKPYVPAEIAPFRLLALGDPQLEGDTSLPDPNAPLFPSLRGWREGAGDARWAGLNEGVRKDLGRLLQGWRKRLDLWGNDLYLAHIYRSVSWWTQPTHTAVLGDLLGSQWVGDEEFQRRTDRFWKRVFKGGMKVPETIADVSGRREILGQDKSWERRIIAVAGNHDIGYAGDINEHRIQRFEDAYGRVNWDLRFRLESNYTSGASLFDTREPELHLIVLNSMNLDSPALYLDLQRASQDFIDEQLNNTWDSSTTGTVLLTHIPFHKEAGICVDAPYFSYFPRDQGGGIREQNHLSEETSGNILNNLMKPGNGRSIVLNGHDHEGCDTHHSQPRSKRAEIGQSDGSWRVQPYAISSRQRAASDEVGVREITVRSMMGSFGGNAGLLSAWFDYESQEWKYEYAVCVLGVQHIWWAVHVLDVIVVLLGIAWLLADIVEYLLMEEDGLSKDTSGKVKKA